MERNYSNDENIPGPTWQNTWITLINRLNREWCDGNMETAWCTIQALFAWLPLECKREVKSDMEKIRGNLQKLGANLIGDLSFRRTANLQKSRHNYLYKALLEMSEKIQTSLEEHGWISKQEQGATPQVKHSMRAHM